jgi:hypothetical protein
VCSSRLVVALGPLALSDGRPSPGLVFAVCGIGLVSGLGASNRFGMDGTATWVLLSSASDRRDAQRDLLGGDLAVAVVTVPAVLLSAGILAVVTGGWGCCCPRCCSRQPPSG